VSGKLNVIMPIASAADWAGNADYLYPKYLVEINNKPLIEHVLENLASIQDNIYFYFILKEEDCLKYHIDNIVKLLVPNSSVIMLKNNTKGAICSVLMAIDSIAHEEECVIVNSDQIIDGSLAESLAFFRKQKADAGILTFNSVHPRWSYALLDNNKVLQTAEKNPISKHAMAGFYYFKSFRLFIEGAFTALLQDDNTNGQYYTSAVLNYLVLLNLHVLQYPISNQQYHSFYSPQRIKEFEQYIQKKNS